MKIQKIVQFQTVEGTAKKTELPLDERPGLFFKVITSSFETPLFTADLNETFAIMTHADRSPTNVKMTIEDAKLVIEQGYRQANDGYLITYSNDDWADTGELKSIHIDSRDIQGIILTTGQRVAIHASIGNLQTYLTSTDFTPTQNVYYAESIIVRGGKEYVFPLEFKSHQSSTSPVRYDYLQANVPRIVNAYSTE